MVALILHTQNRFVETQNQYEHVRAGSPRTIVGSNNLAWLYAEGGGNFDVALGLRKAPLSKHPTDPKSTTRRVGFTTRRICLGTRSRRFSVAS